MRFADPLSVTCPSCGKNGSYAPRDLVALRSRCRYCSSSLESVGREMRVQLSNWSAYLAKIHLAIDLERVLAIDVSDADLDAMKTPLDLIRFFRDRSSVAGSLRDIENEVLAALARSRRTTANRMDLQLDFAELFSVDEHT